MFLGSFKQIYFFHKHKHKTKVEKINIKTASVNKYESKFHFSAGRAIGILPNLSVLLLTKLPELLFNKFNSQLIVLCLLVG